MILTPRRVKMPLFEISANPKIHLSDIKQRGFSLIPRYCPVCEVELSNNHPYHPENGCLYGIIYNINEEWYFIWKIMES